VRQTLFIPYMNNNRTFLLSVPRFLCIWVLLLSLAACSKSESELGALAFKASKNKVFKDIAQEVFAEKLKDTYQAQSKRFRNPKFLKAFYEQRQYEPVVLLKALKDEQMDSIIAVFDNAATHGLKPSMFKAAEIKSLYEQLKDKSKVKNAEDAYTLLAKLELSLANALTDYGNVMQFGAISPRRIYAQYYTETKRPDEKSFVSALESSDFAKYLDSVQPKDKAYLAMQDALKRQSQLSGAGREEAERILIVNLERYRWKNKPTDNKYVWVNIPDFTLDVMDNGKSTLHMKVCVGEGRNQDYEDQLIEYDESGVKKDRPFNRETPQLNSVIHSVQVNPVWNIPESIATNEITKYAAADPYYLENNAIDVYLDGKRIEDPETIDWSAEGAGKMYQFKQRPGADNSLGKIKFLFNNQSAVYLHDTPAKLAFNRQVRAVSHGCVRVEKPLELAKALFGSGSTYQGIEQAMQTGNPRAKDIGLPNKVPVYLTYVTCWLDQSGKLQYRKDVYGLDIVLYTHLKRMA
jgi:murein L,D-transpeptidase YcbB/YkuD